MQRNTPEQDLIDGFVKALAKHKDHEIRLEDSINTNCKSKKYADIEYRSVSKRHWVIEAKSNDSGDAHNTVHKLFGELLKGTGKQNRKNVKYGILIPESGILFYSRKFQQIDRKRFIQFGKLIPVESVFTFGKSGVRQIRWVDLYDANQP